jgi:hypothetical protein
MKEETMSLEQGIQSCNELVLEMAARMGEDDSEDDDEEDAPATSTAAPHVEAAPAAAPTTATPEVAAKEEEDLEMLIPKWEAPVALEVILPERGA